MAMVKYIQDKNLEYAAVLRPSTHSRVKYSNNKTGCKWAK